MKIINGYINKSIFTHIESTKSYSLIVRSVRLCFAKSRTLRSCLSLYMHLLDLRDKTSDCLQATQAYLAKLLNCSVQTIKNQIKKLCDNGFLEVLVTKKSPTKNAPNIYKLTLPDYVLSTLAAEPDRAFSKEKTQACENYSTEHAISYDNDQKNLPKTIDFEPDSIGEKVNLLQNNNIYISISDHEGGQKLNADIDKTENNLLNKKIMGDKKMNGYAQKMEKYDEISEKDLALIDDLEQKFSKTPESSPPADPAIVARLARLDAHIQNVSEIAREAENRWHMSNSIEKPLNYREFRRSNGELDSLKAQREGLLNQLYGASDKISDEEIVILNRSHCTFVVDNLRRSLKYPDVANRSEEILDAVYRKKLIDYRTKGKDLFNCLRVGIKSVLNGTWRAQT